MKTLIALVALGSGSLISRPQETHPPDDEGFIRHWLVLAPFELGQEDAGDSEIVKDQIKEEGKIRPKAGDKVKIGAQERAWKEHTAGKYYLDFREFVGKEPFEDVVGYAVAYVWSESEQKGLKLLIGSNDQAKVYLNGKALLTVEGTRTLDKDQNAIDQVTLKKGENTLILKVINQKNDWQGCARFQGADGKTLKTLKIALAPQ
jgi:hypothetical protein